jgi:hypothetical protein
MNLTVIRRFLFDSREPVHIAVRQLQNAVLGPKILGATAQNWVARDLRTPPPSVS